MKTRIAVFSIMMFAVCATAFAQNGQPLPAAKGGSISPSPASATTATDSVTVQSSSGRNEVISKDSQAADVQSNSNQPVQPAEDKRNPRR